jgi:sulfate adenylyltransferase large subunit
VTEVDLLRLATAGSVDDGKSTLIGRLLHDTKSLMEDQIEHVEEVSRRRGNGYVDLALLVDGLRAEREQGITIDVAYRYFATPRRRFILADTPGHQQYTRNMVTGASTAELAVILVDARAGVTEQTRRHAAIAGLLGVRHVTVCVNKMDLVGFAEERFDAIVRECCSLFAQLGVQDAVYIPISALHGDNVVTRSEHTPWFAGVPLLEHLEAVPVGRDPFSEPARLPVQHVIRPQTGDEALHDFRGYAGQIASGALRPGEEVVVLPRGDRTRIAAIEGPDGPVGEAFAPMSVTVQLEDDVDVARGDLIAPADSPPTATRDLVATLCWLADQPARPGARYLVKHTTRTVRARLEAIEHRLDVTTLGHEPAGELALNDIGLVRLRLAEPVVADPYEEIRGTGERHARRRHGRPLGGRVARRPLPDGYPAAPPCSARSWSPTAERSPSASCAPSTSSAFPRSPSTPRPTARRCTYAMPARRTCSAPARQPRATSTSPSSSR